MGRETDVSPPEVVKYISNDKLGDSPRRPGLGLSSGGSLTKSSGNVWGSYVSPSSVKDESPLGTNHISARVSRRLEFSSSRSVSSKVGSQISCKTWTPQHQGSNGTGVPNGDRLADNAEPESEYNNASITSDELRQIEQVLQSSGSRLEELYKKVSESTFKDLVSIFERLQWDILKETGYMNWFGLGFTLAGYLSYHCEEVGTIAGEKWVALKAHSNFITDQLDELKLCLESDSDIFKLAAGTLLYCCSVVRHLEHRHEKCSCFGSRSSHDRLQQQVENTVGELKSLQDNLTFATLASVGNRVSQPITSPGALFKRLGPDQLTLSVGLEQHVVLIMDFMKNNGVCLVGIHGQAGLGKTTLLNGIVSKVEKTEKRLFAYIEVSDDLRRLQSSLLQQLGGGKKEFNSTAQGRNALLYQLRKLKQNNKVVRIAIDNLFDVRLVGELFPHSLGKVLSAKSSVIITCPSLAILTKVDQLCRSAMPGYHYLPYKLPCLNPQQAKTLFISHVASEPVNTPFSINGVLSKYGDLADHFLPLCEGLPMALKVVGSYFSNPANCNEENWIALAKRMKQVAEEMESTEDQMFAKLQVLFEKLGPAQREAFLDIAVFFQDWDWRMVERIVGKPQLDTLVDQALVNSKLRDTDSVSGIAQLTRYSEQPWKTDMVMMHDLLNAIACRRAQGNRVLSEDQAHLPDRLLMDTPGNELSLIQGLSLISCKEALHGTMLEKMQGVRVLILHDTHMRGSCTKPLNQLQFLYWGRSQVAQDVRLPFQLGRLRNLEMLILRANEMDLSIKFPPQLKDLTLIGCNNMEELPETVLLLTGLLELHLNSCSRLQDLTHLLGNLKMLQRLRLENCLSIRQLPKSIGQLVSVREMDLSGCTNITTLPSEMGSLQAMRKLNLTRCKCLVRLPPEIGSLRNMTHLCLAQCGITTLPAEIGQLCALQDFSLSGCIRVEKLPKEIGLLCTLLRLNLSSCTNLKELPREIGNLGSLQKLSLNSCCSLSRLPNELFELDTLQALDLDYCKLLAHLPAEIGNLRCLQRLSLNCCTRLNRLPLEVRSLPSLQVLNLVGCTGLKPDQAKLIQNMTKEHSVYVYREDDAVILEGPKNPSFKLYSMTY